LHFTLLLIRVLFDGILEILQHKKVPNQAIAILLLHSSSFLPSLCFPGPVIKKEKLLAKLRDWPCCWTVSRVLSAA